MSEKEESISHALSVSWQGERVPYLAEYLGIWMYEPNQFLLGVQHVQRMNIAQHVQTEREKRAPAATADALQETATAQVRRGYAYDVTDGIAVVQISGSLMKHVSSMDESTSTVMMRNTVRQLRRDASVKAAILVIDSPGGTVSGAYDLADDIGALSKVKPVYAYAEDLCASAAYLMASQTRGISANRNGLVGSIGTYGVIYDYSKMFEQEGVKAFVISSGDMKGLGVPGTEISTEQLDYLQKQINTLNDLFIDYVAKRPSIGAEKAKALANGRVYIGADAVKQGLVDRIETFDSLFNRVWKETNPSSDAPRRGSSVQTVGQITTLDAQDRWERQLDKTETKHESTTAEAAESEEDATVVSAEDAGAEAEPKGGADMAQTNSPAAQGAKADEPKPATIEELQKAFVSDPAFALEAAKNAWTLTEAKAAYSDKLQQKLTSVEQENSTLRQENTSLKDGKSTTKVGVEPITSANAGAASTKNDDADVQAELEQRIEPLVKAGKTRQQATQAVFAADDDFRQLYVKSLNAQKAA